MLGHPGRDLGPRAHLELAPDLLDVCLGRARRHRRPVATARWSAPGRRAWPPPSHGRSAAARRRCGPARASHRGSSTSASRTASIRRGSTDDSSPAGPCRPRGSAWPPSRPSSNAVPGSASRCSTAVRARCRQQGPDVGGVDSSSIRQTTAAGALARGSRATPRSPPHRVGDEVPVSTFEPRPQRARISATTEFRTSAGARSRPGGARPEQHERLDPLRCLAAIAAATCPPSEAPHMRYRHARTASATASAAAASASTTGRLPSRSHSPHPARRPALRCTARPVPHELPERE